MIYDIYLAGPFFNEYEVDLNRQASEILKNRGFSVFVPQEHFVPNGENMPNDEWGEAVFKMDRDAIQDCKYVVAIYHGMYSDSGTAWEIGYAYALKKKILVVCITENKSSLMIVNGCASVVDNIELLREFNFNEFPKFQSTTEQK